MPLTAATKVHLQLYTSEGWAWGSPGYLMGPCSDCHDPPTSTLSPSSATWLGRVRGSTVAIHSCMRSIPSRSALL